MYIFGGGGGLVAKSYPTLVTPWTVARQAPLSKGFSGQEYWSRLPFSLKQILTEYSCSVKSLISNSLMYGRQSLLHITETTIYMKDKNHRRKDRLRPSQ